LKLKCGFCGLDYSEEEGIQACKGCPMSNCNMTKCPNCGYDNLPEPDSLKWLKDNLRGKKRRKVLREKNGRKVLNNEC